jgi:hypothetical protein
MKLNWIPKVKLKFAGKKEKTFSAVCGKGCITLPLTDKQFFVVHGGPYRDIPLGMMGVKMAVEITAESAVNIPTKDFNTPPMQELYKGLDKAVALILAGEPVYVGCMGGIGRTGLFLAILAKTFGVKNPIQYVRRHYFAHAVETAEQIKFVKAFIPNPRVRTRIKNARRGAWLFFWRKNLTNLSAFAKIKE